MNRTSFTRTSFTRTGGTGGIADNSFLSFNGLTDHEGARAVARRLFDFYDRDRDGRLENSEVVPMIVDAYKSFNRQYNPSRGDIESYARILDRNRDNRITYEDIESLCYRYLLAQPIEKVEVPKKAVYSAEVERRLDLARRLFKQIDADGSGYIGESEVPNLLIETYKQMGVNNYQPTRDDVKSWMDMVDRDHDGKVTLPDYEAFVIRSLKNAGFQIDEQGIVM